MPQRNTLFPGPGTVGRILSPGDTRSTDQSLNAKRGTNFPGPGDTGKILDRASIPLEPESNSGDFQHKRPRTPNIQEEPHELIVKKPRTTATVSNDRPWHKYRKLVPYMQGGRPLIAACQMDEPDKIVAIRVTAVEIRANLQRLQRIEHANVLYCIYEPMPTTVAEIQGCPLGPLRERELASICQNVCNGMNYIQKELLCDVKNITTEDLCVDDYGVVKIADVATVLFHDTTTRAIQSSILIKQLMISLMEPGTSMLDSAATILRRAETWETLILDFLAACERDPVQEIVKHAFLSTAPDSVILVPYVEAARRCRWHEKVQQNE